MRRHKGGYCCQYVQNNFFLNFKDNFISNRFKPELVLKNYPETQESVYNECIHKILPFNYNIIDCWSIRIAGMISQALKHNDR